MDAWALKEATAEVVLVGLGALNMVEKLSTSYSTWVLLQVPSC